MVRVNEIMKLMSSALRGPNLRGLRSLKIIIEMAGIVVPDVHSSMQLYFKLISSIQCCQ